MASKSLIPLVLALAAQPLHAQTATLDIEAKATTKNFAGVGFALEDANSAAQASAQVALQALGGTIDASVWGNYGLGGAKNNAPSEVDVSVGYTRSFGNVSARVGVATFMYPDGILSDVPDNFLRFGLTRSDYVDIGIDALLRANDGLGEKQMNLNITASKALPLVEKPDFHVSIIPSVGMIYNHDIFGLTGYAGTKAGTTLSVNTPAGSLSLNGMYFKHNGEHTLGTRKIKDQFVFSAGIQKSMRLF